MLNTPDSPNTPKLGMGTQSPSDSPADNNQDSYKDLGLAALVILAQFHGIAINAADIQHRYDVNGVGLDQSAWILAAREIGLKAKVSAQKLDRLHMAALPALAWREDGQHFILAKVDDERYLIQDLQQGRPVILTKEEFTGRYSGVLILVVSVVIQLFALITPIFFQVVMDKVLVHRGFSTLDVIAFAFLVVIIFEVVLGGLRTYIFAHTTSRIDVELGARLFRHMLSLPIAYFENRRVGDTVARVRELEQIRNFLTGQALTSVLDLCFSFIFIAVMWYYSGWLTLIVLISLPCYAIWSATISPVLRSRLNDKFARNADSQSFLVESVTTMGTIKSMAVEPQMTRRWDQQLAAYVAAGFKVTRLATIGQQGVQLIQKLVVVATLWFGARLVINGDMTVGQLIAFNMLAGQVAAPVIRLAQLWQDFQQVGISVARLGDILNTPTENPTSRMALPDIKGFIGFDRVSFRYRPDAPEILREFSLNIRAGEVLGIVGRSGSGKSTVTKLVQRLYVPEHGRVMIDGNDLALADPAWLRRQIGVVLQENILMNRSVRDNIALADPGMPLERIMQAAKMAGAHEFIMELPEGYDSMVGEQGAGLSGGQRQRIAIARALVSNPRILILDEATSALDYESERAIMQNMETICKGRTVIIIAHRLSTVRRCHRIIAMDKGQIIEQGTHKQLLEQNGYYKYLHDLQAA